MTADTLDDPRRVIDIRTREPVSTVHPSQLALGDMMVRAATGLFCIHGCGVLVIVTPLAGERMAYALGSDDNMVSSAVRYVERMTAEDDGDDGA